MKTKIKKQQSWQMFNVIARRYEVVNDVLSLGIHRLWRQELVKQLPRKKNLSMLDCATGTGSIVFAVMDKCSQWVNQLIGSDLSEGMMAVAKERLKIKPYHQKVSFQVADACHLPMKDLSFDVVSMAFGIRNVPDYKKCLSEIYRVLQPSGKAMILEFSIPRNPLIKLGYLFYFRYLMPVVGGIVSGKFFAYKYLNQTVEHFPYGDAFVKQMISCGFQKVQAKPLTFGIATLYTGEK